ncbi:MAG: hypothetical protein JSU81_01690 [Candidatus Coatesbacteria bacterium]|nr:MAG: hypothetical protein JSU81_01690 [Candidatus Coatesbacteria bacterium]
MYDFKTDPHFECLAHLTTRETDAVVRVEGWYPEADGRTRLWFDRHQYFSRTYKSHLIAEIHADGSETIIYHDMLADHVDVEPGRSYHIWIMAAEARPGSDGKLQVEKAPSGHGHVRLYRRLHPDEADLPPKGKSKKSAWSKLFRGK